jgi:RpiB/LacA/LacB family sugar-phosphate isomerase
MKTNNLIIPIAGQAKRFLDAGYRLPKPMITVGNRMMIDLAMQSVDYQDSNLIFIVREDHVREFSIDEVLRQKFGDDVTVVKLDTLTQGTLCTCLLAVKQIKDLSLPTFIYTPDVTFPQVALEVDDKYDGFLFTFKANSPSHSYCAVEGDLVVEVAEKQVISDQANVGLYYWKTGHDLVHYGEKLIHSNDTVNGEYYVAPVFNYMIRYGKTVGYHQVPKFYVLGTPADTDFFERRVLPVFGDKPVGLCSDHSGFQVKNWVFEQLGNTIDFGCYSLKDCDSIDFLKPAVQHIQNGVCDFVIASCRTANGMAMAANKFDGIHAAIVHDEFTAEYAIRHNAANVFCIPERNMTESLIHKILSKLESHTFDGGRFATRLMKVPHE